MRKISEYNYTGPSMRPLFRPGDGLMVTPGVGFDRLRRGDVICFINPHGPKRVVHRIVRISAEGLSTRGDNNPEADPYRVGPGLEPVLVTAIRRGGKTIKVRGGSLGMLIHYKNLSTRFVKRNFYPRLRGVLAGTAATGCLYGFKLFDKKLEVKSYKTLNGVKEFLFVGKRRAGHRLADGRWHIRIPWCFFIDPGRIDEK